MSFNLQDLSSALAELPANPSSSSTPMSMCLVLLPVQQAAAASTALSVSEGEALYAALPRLLAANAMTVATTSAGAVPRPGLLMPASTPSSTPSSTSSSTSSRASSSSLWATSPPFVPLARNAQPADEADVDVDVLPSFGARTAAAKQLLSAAPGGPVFGNRTSGGNINDSIMYQKKKFKKAFCPFCKKNGERRETYTGHGLNERRPDGSSRVICPVLRSLRCEICGSTGDAAHTRTHCPLGLTELPVATILKSTQRRCDGTKRSFFQ